MTTHIAVRPAFAELIDLWGPLRQLGTGFEFCEGPIWHPREQHLLFSDMPGDVRRRWDRSGVREVKRPANKCNGMTYDAGLNLIVCEHATSSRGGSDRGASSRRASSRPRSPGSPTA